ncbi:MAG: hypothetical protein ACI3Y9_00870 [Candidatus Cryptobacteroides sp.]
MVRDIILEKDEVALPGLGMFVAEFVPASFSDKGYTINPPYKRLSFRQVDKPDDMTLALLYAKANNIGEDTAAHFVNDFLVGLKNVLMEKKNVLLPGLGKLRATRENTFFFIADEDLDIYPEGFGLEAVSLKTHQETVSEVAETMAGLRSILDSDPELYVDSIESIGHSEDGDDIVSGGNDGGDAGNEGVVGENEFEPEVNEFEPEDNEGEREVNEGVDVTVVSDSEKVGGDNEPGDDVGEPEPEAVSESAVVAEAVGEIGEEARPETGSEDIVLLIEGVETEPESDSAVASAAVAEDVAETFAELPSGNCTESSAESCAELQADHCDETHTGHIDEAPAVNCEETPADHIDEAPADKCEGAPAAMSEALSPAMSTEMAEVAPNEVSAEACSVSAEACSGTADVLASKAETVQEPESATDTPVGGSRFWKIFRIIVVALVIIAILALAAFIILSRVAPDFIDAILYSPEELEIIRHMSSS